MGALFAVYGANGCGRGIMPLARIMLARERSGAAFELVFVDDAPQAAMINGHRVLSYQQFVAAETIEKHVCIAIANSSIREKLSVRCAMDNISTFSVFAENIVLMDDVQIGEGCVLSPFVTLTSNIKIGRQFQANLYSYVEHDCVIGDFVTFAPAVKCNGNVVIEDHAYIGAGAVLRQGKPGEPLVIGQGAVVGMGAVVTKSVPAGMTVVGNPARPLI
jgi:sugar O-acyltransferase (sialic acid O-acetyltransferase NeuD family)